MTKLSTAALLAVGIFAIYSAPSFAAQVITQPKQPQPPCTVNCGGGGGQPTEPGDPFNPFDPDPDPEDGTIPDPGNPDDPDKDPGNPDEDPGNPDNPDKDPGNPGGDPKDPGKNPNDPGKDAGKQASAELKKCLARLDDLPVVSASVIGRFDQPHKVSLTPICEVSSLTDVQPVLIEGGNVAGLEPALRANELIRGKLGQTAYKTRDVVGIDFDANGNAVLLVHRHRG